MTHINDEMTNGPNLRSFGDALNVAVVGATGGIGRALAKALTDHKSIDRILLFSRSDPKLDHEKALWRPIDIEDEQAVAEAARTIGENVSALHLVIVASGILHDEAALKPEKTWRSINPHALRKAYSINTVGPAVVAKHFLPLLASDRKSAFAALSARVGSISDNHLGGWYAYRASKAALNMIIKTLAIELARTNSNALCIALHPGTVDTQLSRPFQASVPKGKLFTPEFSARRLLSVINDLTSEHTGKIFAWDGAEIAY